MHIVSSPAPFMFSNFVLLSINTLTAEYWGKNRPLLPVRPRVKMRENSRLAEQIEIEFISVRIATEKSPLIPHTPVLYRQGCGFENPSGTFPSKKSWKILTDSLYQFTIYPGTKVWYWSYWTRYVSMFTVFCLQYHVDLDCRTLIQIARPLELINPTLTT